MKKLNLKRNGIAKAGFVVSVFSVLLLFIFNSSVIFAQEGNGFSAIQSNGLASFSDYGGQLLLTDYENGELWLVNVSGQETGQRKIISLKSKSSGSQHVRILSPKFSPQGEHITFASFDESSAKPFQGLVWRADVQGNDLKTVGNIVFDPHRMALLQGDFLSFGPKGKQIIVMNHDIDKSSTSVYASLLNMNEWNPFVWQEHLLSFHWSSSKTFLAYFTQKEKQISDPLSFGQSGLTDHDSVELWVTRADGGQLKKSSESVYQNNAAKEIPFSWSYDERYFAYFHDQIDENSKRYRELHLQRPQESSAYVAISTWGYPQGSPKWSKDGGAIAFVESSSTESDASNNAAKLVTLDLKFKNRKFVGTRKINTLAVNEGTVLVGWDSFQKNNLLLLEPVVNEKENYYRLVKQDRYKANRRLTLVEPIPSEIFYEFDMERRKILFCGKTTGCLLFNTANQNKQWVHPNYAITVALGDFHVRAGDPQGGLAIFNTLKAKYLERDLWIGLMTRRYLTTKLVGQSDRANKIWNNLLDRIEKGETLPQDYLVLAKSLESLGESRLSLKMYQKIQDDFPSSYEARVALLASGFLFHSIKEYKFAKNCFANYVRIYPKDPEAPNALVELGRTYLSMDQPGTALKVFRKIITTFKDDISQVNAFLGKARALEKMNRFSEAKKTYEVIIEKFDVSDRGIGHHQVAMKQEEAKKALNRLNQF